MHPALNQTAHRPWPLPAGPWVMAQSWHDLLFAHWPIDVAELRTTLRPHIPDALAIDTFEDQAWIGVVPFRMSGVRLRATPAMPALSGGGLDGQHLVARASRTGAASVRMIASRSPGVPFTTLYTRFRSVNAHLVETSG